MTMASTPKKKKENIETRIALYSRWDGRQIIPVYDISDELTRCRYDPIAAMVELANNAEDEKIRFQAAAKLFDAVVASRRSVPVEPMHETTKLVFDVQIADSSSMVKEVTPTEVKTKGKTVPFFKTISAKSKLK